MTPATTTFASSETPIDAPLDCLAIAAHPDDAELFAGGTLALAARKGRRVGIVDLTRGECGTRGTPETRAGEARAAAEILGLTLRENLDLGDGDLANTQERRRAVVETIRRLRPRLILTHWPDERHPDHRRAYELVRDATFLANVGGWEAAGERWLVQGLAFGMGNTFNPDPLSGWVVDVSDVFEQKLAAVKAFGTQFLASDNNPASATYVASAAFWERVNHRAGYWGHLIGVQYGEPFVLDRPAHAGHLLVKLTQ